MATKTVNEVLLREALRHQVELEGFSTGVVQRLIAVLERSNVRLLQELQRVLESETASTFTMQRLESLLSSVRSVSVDAYTQIGKYLTQELRDFINYEVGYQSQVLMQSVPAPVAAKIAAVSAEQVYTAALARPFQGVLLNNVWPDFEAQKFKLVRQAIAQGFVEGKTTDQIVRELRGTRAKGYSDGLLQRPLRDVQAVAQTAIGHMAGFAQDKVIEANVDLIKYVKLVATLDNRTSSGCRLRDGLLYTPDDHKPVGHKVPWGAGPLRYHYRCRTGSAPVLKSFKELGVDLPEIEVDGKTRASMDGQVPADLAYKDWIKEQPAARQDEILGPARARLIREGKLELPDMYSPTGKAYTLDELRKRDEQAFRLAGL